MNTVTKAPASVAVIVCAYTLERIDDLWACIDALHQQDSAADEIVCVVDNNAELRAAVDRAVTPRGWDRLTVIDNAATPGLSGARNTGVAHTSSEIVVFIDDDAVPATNWLTEIVAPFTSGDVAAAGGRIEPGWPEQRPTWFPPHLDWTIGCSIPTLPADGGPIRNMYGASAAFRRSKLDAAGGFPTELGRVGANGAGCEETEVCIRIRQQNNKAIVMYAPRSEVVHRVTTERATVRYVINRCLAEGRSKAQLSKRVGGHDATGDERSYALIMARAVAGDLVGGLRRPTRLGRAAVLAAGLTAASAAYLVERLRGIVKR